MTIPTMITSSNSYYSWIRTLIHVGMASIQAFDSLKAPARPKQIEIPIPILHLNFQRIKTNIIEDL